MGTKLHINRKDNRVVEGGGRVEVRWGEQRGFTGSVLASTPLPRCWSVYLNAPR